LVLADAISYALESEPDMIIDMATLTGACVVALGGYTCGLFTNSDTMLADMMAAAEKTGESFWRMPLDSKIRNQLDSDVADIKNVGKRWGGAITAALFLQEFVNEKDWVHLDIAGPAYVDAALGHIPKGGTGFAVSTLTQLLKG
jgi:leucyl aminopeptidase